MKKSILLAVFAVATIFTTSCSKDDSVITTVTTKNLTTDIDENSSAGTVLGKLIGSSNTGTVTYTMLSQSINGALAINATNGEVTIADASLFDFETNPQFTANVEVADGEVKENATVTINLNDKDDIEFLLSTSKSAYQNAADDNWVEITKEEYDGLAQKLNEVTKAGLNDTDYEADHTNLNGGANNFTVAMTGGSSVRIPKNAYTIAFKYVSKEAGSRTNDRVKTSSSSDPLKDYSNLGEKLPSHTGIGEHYFVIKNNKIKNTADGHLAFYSSKATGYKRISSINNAYRSGDVNSLRGTENIIYQFQAITSTQKQW